MVLIYDIIPPSELRVKQGSGSFIKSALLRIVVLLLIIGLNWTGLSTLVGTRAYLNDIESSTGNVYTAGILDFVLVSLSDFSPAVIGPTQVATRTIEIVNNGNIHKYKVSAVDFFGSLCDWLDLETDLDGGTEYIGNLTDFVDYGPIIFEEPENWVFNLSLRPGMPDTAEGETCEFKFVFSGSQTKNDLPFGMGFSDIEDISNKLASTGLKINKVYYDVDDEHGSELDNEWVEIYNPMNKTVDVSGWKICDNDSCVILPVVDPLESHKFAVITSDSTTWDYWEIPDDVIKVELGSLIGDGLDNDGDRVILKNLEDIEVDAMSWETDTYAFDPACPDVDEGHMLGRNPTGYDTDTAGDWKDYALPTAHVDYPNGGEVWYVGRTHTMRWTATNPSGNDADLIIDLYYSADSGATWATVVKGTENDKSYDWRIPLFVGDYFIPSSRARIKVVATNPENFMVSAWDMSDEDFCPPIDFDLLTPEELEIARDLGLISSPPEEPATPVEDIEEVIEEILEDEIIEEIEEPAQNPEDIEAGPPACETCGGEPLDKDTPEPVEQLPAPDEEPVIKEEPVIIPKNPASQEDDEGGDNNDSTDDNVEEIESVEVPVDTE